MLVHVIDDELSVAHLVCEFLRREGFTTQKYTSAADYIAQTVSEVPDLIITDLLLPGVDGFKLCETVRRHPKLRAVPIIAMTALTWRADGSISVELMQRFGVVTVLQKPFTKQLLLDAAKKVFGTRWPKPADPGTASAVATKPVASVVANPSAAPAKQVVEPATVRAAASVLPTPVVAAKSVSIAAIKPATANVVAPVPAAPKPSGKATVQAPLMADVPLDNQPIATIKKAGSVEPLSVKDATHSMLQDSARKSLRYPVRFKSSDAFVAEYTKNISAGGMFIASQVPPPVFSEVIIEMSLPDGLPPLELKGSVVHATPGMGFGLQFSKPSGEATTRWQKMLKQEEAGAQLAGTALDGPDMRPADAVCVPLGLNEEAMAELWRLVGLLWRQSVVVEPVTAWPEVIAMEKVNVVLVDTRLTPGHWFDPADLQAFAAHHPAARLIVYGPAPIGLSQSLTPPVTVVEKGPTERLVSRLAEWLGIETRASIRVPVKVAGQVGKVIGQVVDVSVTGVRFAANHGFKVNDDVELRLSLDEQDVVVPCRVRWSRETSGQIQTGLSFEQVDQTSLDALSRFVDQKALLFRTVSAVRRKADEQ